MTLLDLLAATRRAALSLVVCGMAWSGPAAAQAFKATDARAIRAVVQSQLAAFARDDAIAAFSHAAPAVRRMFVTPQRFMAMVQAQYPMVHHPAAVSFLKPESEQGEVLQRVQLTDTEGSHWIASYVMQRGKDGRWRIGACLVAPAPQRLTT